MTIINQKRKQFMAPIIIGLIVFTFASCVDRFENIDKYKRPDRLKGKIYTQILEQSNMSIFAKFMEDIGFDKVVDKTGTYAAFVPTDSVMEIYLNNTYGTSDPSNIDSVVKQKIVKYHLLQMPWTKDQLQSLSSRGWINPNDLSNNEPTAFKRLTLYKEPNRTYKIRRFLSGNDPFEIILPDNAVSSETRTVITRSAKFVPLFYDGFMDAAGLSPEDYSFYFKRPYESGEVFYANAKILGDEIFAENGFVYTIDRVVEPLKNAEQILESGPYNEFLQLIHNNSVFRENEAATFAQEGADEGLEVNTLYDLSYSVLPMNIHDEIVGNLNTTVEAHNGLLAPTNQATNDFFNTYLKAWGPNWNAVPRQIRELYVKSHMPVSAIYKKDLSDGFYNSVGEIVDENDFEFENENAIYASNSTFIGLNKAVVPKSFSTVSAPLYLDPAYNSFFAAFVSFDAISALKDPSTNFSLFIINDNTFAKDSTLFATELPNGNYDLRAFDQGELKFVNLMGSQYKGQFKRRLFGHVGIQPLLGQARREYIETLDGRHIVVQNDTVSGGVPSEFKFNNSGRDTTVVFEQITDYTITNGSVFKCDGWLKFPKTNIYEHVRGTQFLTLLDKAGLASLLNERLTFPNPSERYTMFVPSNAALNEIQADTFTLEEIKKFVNFHIVKGDLIFTDGRLPRNAYRTLNNQFINLDPQPDNILILDENNEILYDDVVLSDKTNLLGMHPQNIDDGYFITNAVVHKIDTVIMPY